MKTTLQSISCSIGIFVYAISVAQPSLSLSNVGPVTGDKFIYNVTTYVNPGNAGAAQTWDLSAVTSSGKDTTTMMPVSSTPYAANYSNATISGKTNQGTVGVNYGYFKLSSTAYQSYGAVNSTGVIMANSNPEDILRFPFTYNNTYTDNWAVSFVSGGYTFYRTGLTTVTADGYGTLKLPGKNYANVLRVHFVETYKDSANFGAPYIINYKNDEYMWYLPGNHSAIAATFTLTTDLGNSSSARYLNTIVSSVDEIETGISSFSIFPNPSSSYININFDIQENKKATVRLLNSVGAEVYFAEPFQGTMGSNHYEFGVSNLSEGIYFAQVYLEGKIAVSRSFVVIK